MPTDKISSILVLQACILLGAAICFLIVNTRYPRAIARALTLYAYANLTIAAGGMIGVLVEPAMPAIGQLGDLGLSTIGTCLYYFAFRGLGERKLHMRLVALLYLLTMAGVAYFSGIRHDASMSVATVCCIDIVLNGLVMRDLFRNFTGHGRSHLLMGASLALYVLALILWTLTLLIQPHQPMLIDHVSVASSYAMGALCITAAMGPVTFLLMCNDEFNTQIQTMAATDPLTGVANRRRLMERAIEEIARAHRYGHAMTVMMVDLDHFKKLNDTHGHETGDRALRAVANVCVATLRDIDLISRVGGEEFAILLPQAPLGKGIEVAERLRRAVAAIELTSANGPLSLSASLGVAELAADDATIDPVLARADRALYRAKADGRNRVIAEETVLGTPVPDGEPA